MTEWIGSSVSIRCKNTTFQGEIISATNSHITLTKAFCDGIPAGTASITILASEISDLKLINKQESVPEGNDCSTISIAKPTVKRGGRSQSFSENKLQNGNSTKSKPIDIQQCSQQQFAERLYEASTYKAAVTMTKKDKNKQKWGKGWKDEACFGSPLDQSFLKEFDFEKNLALFDKQAVFEEINSHRPDLVKHDKKPTKYRHDENVIATVPTTLRQITVPNDVYEYVTDDGLVIPTISRALRKRLWMSAEHVGLSWERRAELMGRATTEMAVQLLGGAHRLNPQNTHQWPTVAFLIGPNRQGAIGINAARQLASQGVKTIVYSIPNETEVNQKEMYLYKLTQNRSYVGLGQVPQNVDLIIVSLCEDGENLKLFSHVSDWISGVKAPILALDPPAVGTPGISAKFSLVPVLPLAHSPSNGKIYLCNLGFPSEIFTRVNINYKSPFGPKFVIPLHPNESS